MNIDLAVDYIRTRGKGDMSVKTAHGKYGVKRVDVTCVTDEQSVKTGRYVTFCNFSELHDPEQSKYYSLTLANGIRDVIYSNVKQPSMKVLIAGLGNRHIVADSLGALVSGKIIVTRHNHADFRKNVRADIKSVAVISPSVSGVTGITAFEAISANAKEIKPDVIIVIDSLMTDDIDNLATSVQITDTGITPGSAVGEKSGILSREVLKIPVISIGVPFAVSADGIVKSKRKDLCVTRRAIDVDVTLMADVIARALNMALYDFLSYEEIAEMIR